MQLDGMALLLGALVLPLAPFVTGCQREPLTRKTFCDRWASAACTAQVVSVCQTGAAECQASQATSCRDWLPEDFQDVGVDECLSAVNEAYADADLDAAELDIVWRLGAPCNGIVVAGVSGETCESDANCSASTGLTCVFKDQPTGTCERAEIVEAGFSCAERAEQCEPGFFCNGENCIVAGDAGDDCVNDSQCAEGHSCQQGLCEAQASVGADCTTDRECESDICYEVDVSERVCVDRIRLSPAEPACDALK
jgi:hypothetical protein